MEIFHGLGSPFWRMVVAVLFLQKHAVVFILTEVALQESGEKVDQGVNFVFRQALTEELRELRPSGQLQKTGDGFSIQFFIQAKTDILGIYGHDGCRE
jgi:hypothetical protein